MKIKPRASRIKFDLLVAVSSVLGWVVALALLTAVQAESSGKTTAAYVQDITDALGSVKNISPDQPPHLDSANSNRRGVRLMDNTTAAPETKPQLHTGSEVEGL